MNKQRQRETTNTSGVITYAITVFARYVFMLLWAFFAIAKGLGHQAFTGVLSTSPWVNYGWASFLAWVLFGLFTTLFLLLGLPIRRMNILGFIGSTGLMGFFTLYVAYMLIAVDTIQLPCSCGAFSAEISWKDQLIINGLLTMLACWAAFLAFRGSTGLPP